MAGLRYIESVITLKLDQSKCNGCGICLKVCPHEVFVREKPLVRIADRGACMECGACARNCEPGAISVNSGVGCAAAMINASLRGAPEVECTCCGDGA
jgi:ferredoxin